MKHLSFSFLTYIFVFFVFETHCTAQSIDLEKLLYGSSTDSNSVAIDKAIETKSKSVDKLWETINKKYSTDNNIAVKYELSKLASIDSLWRKEPSSNNKITQADIILTSLKKIDSLFVTMKYIEASNDSLLLKTNRISVTFKPLYKEDLDTISKLQQRNKTSTKVIERIETGSLISELLHIIVSYNSRIEKSDSNISKPFKVVAKGFEDNFPQLYKSIVPYFVKRIEQYEAMTSYLSKADTSEKLETDVKYLSLVYDTLKNYDQFIKKELPLLKNNYEKTYNTIYKTMFVSIDRLIYQYNDIIKLDEKILAGRSINNKLITLKDEYEELQRIDNLLLIARNEITPLYKENYSPIYKAEIKSLLLQTDQYYVINSLESKLKTGRELSTKFTFLQSAFKEIQTLDDDILQGKQRLEGKYKTIYPKMYATQVKANNGISVTSQEDVYQKSGNAKQKIQTGQKIVADIKKYENLFDSIMVADQKIQNEFNTLAFKYKEQYPKVYSAEIKTSNPFSSNITLAKEIELYLDIDLIEVRITRSVELLKKIDWYNSKLTETQDDDIYMASQYPILESKYKSGFPLIYSTEIKKFNLFGTDTTLNGQIEALKNLDKMDSKIYTSKKLRAKVDFLLHAYDTITTLDKELKILFQQIDYKYKAAYPKIYTKEINNSGNIFGSADAPTLNNELQKYTTKNSVSQKLYDAKNLKEKMENLDKNYTLLNALKQDINEKQQKFQAIFANDKKSAVILKKGTVILKELNDTYEDEPTAQLRLNKGENVRQLLNKLISYNEKDNTYLIEQLKKAKNTNSIKSAFGVSL